jgi:hypothetical protein
VRVGTLPKVLAGLALLAGGASAQVAVQVRTTAASQYIWRGLAVVNRPVLQPDLTLSAGPASLGLWSNVEPLAYHGAGAISALNGRAAPGFTEFDPYLELAHALGSGEVAVGAIGYLYPRSAGHEAGPNTAEVYGRATLPDPLPLQLAGYYDVRAVRGLYLEASLERPAPGWSRLRLGARAGASFGEATGPLTSYYDADGLTHLELGAGLPFAAGPFGIRPDAYLDVGFDRATRIVAPDRSRRLRLWLALAVGWPAASAE